MLYSTQVLLMLYPLLVFATMAIASHDPTTVEPQSAWECRLQWNLVYLGSVGPKGPCNFKIARNSEFAYLLHVHEC